MGDLSNHLSRHEVGCKCGCGFDAADTELIDVLEHVMNHFETLKAGRLKLFINSWNRCEKHNKFVGGAPSSKHVKGTACDFRVENIHEDEVADYLESEYPNKYGIGRYDGRTHVDVRKTKARWDNRGIE